MKPLLSIVLLLSMGILRGADAAPVGPRELVLEMHLQQIEMTSDDGLRLAATLSDGDKEAVLEVKIPPRTTRKGEKVRGTGADTYRFPVYLQASAADAAVFERVIAAHFGAQARNSFVRKDEYGGGALQKPGNLGKEGGTIFLTDPTGHPFNWQITIQIDPIKRRLTLKAGETRYG